MNSTTKSTQQKPTNPQIGKLILVRHTESEWNQLAKWTGRTDVRITDKGKADAYKVGRLLKDIPIDVAFYSGQIRTAETLHEVLAGSGQLHVPHIRTEHLNERDYGEYTGLNKWEVQQKVGDEEFG
ncbi:MAG TPA: 2,3-bisphosphoglycerate-dependent phosphoglycerate mutase, partial [Hymenobacter sp.]